MTELMPNSWANSARALRCPQPTSRRPGRLFLSQPALGNGWLSWDLLSCMSSSWPSATHRSAFGFWLVLKGCPGQAEQTQSLWFSLFLSSSPVKWECGKEISLCKLLVHNCCWVLYLSAHPSACHHAAATTHYLFFSFSFFLNLVFFLSMVCLAAGFCSFFLSPLLSPCLCISFFLPVHLFATCVRPGLWQEQLTPFKPPGAVLDVCRREMSHGHGTKMNFTPVIRPEQYCSKAYLENKTQAHIIH